MWTRRPASLMNQRRGQCFAYDCEGNIGFDIEVTVQDHQRTRRRGRDVAVIRHVQADDPRDGLCGFGRHRRGDVHRLHHANGPANIIVVGALEYACATVNEVVEAIAVEQVVHPIDPGLKIDTQRRHPGNGV